MEWKYDGKVAIVTGGTSGIGEGICLAYGENGIKVVVAGRNEERGEKVVSEIVKAGGEATFIKTDVAIEEDVINLVDKTIEKYSKLDIIVNNAGIGGPCGIMEFTSDRWDTMMNINTRGVFFGIKYAMPHLIKTKGCVITVSSYSGLKPLKDLACYSASKAAAIAVTQVAALEYASYGVRCNIICPGYIDTPIMAIVPQEMKEAEARHIPLGRVGQPRDIANLALYLAADENNWTTGHAFCPDGGVTLL